MPQTGLGVALKTLRERRTLSLREIGQLSSVDHAYVHRLETGEKTNPSQDLVEKLLKVLKPGERDAALVMWLVDHADADPSLVEFVLQDPSISIDVFSAAAGVRHRGNARPDPATLIARIKKAFDDDEEVAWGGLAGDDAPVDTDPPRATPAIPPGAPHLDEAGPSEARGGNRPGMGNRLGFLTPFGCRLELPIALPDGWNPRARLEAAFDRRRSGDRSAGPSSDTHSGSSGLD